MRSRHPTWPRRSRCQDMRSNKSRRAQSHLSRRRAHSAFWTRPGVLSAPSSSCSVAARLAALVQRSPHRTRLECQSWPSHALSVRARCRAGYLPARWTSRGHNRDRRGQRGRGVRRKLGRRARLQPRRWRGASTHRDGRRVQSRLSAAVRQARRQERSWRRPMWSSHWSPRWRAGADREAPRSRSAHGPLSAGSGSCAKGGAPTPSNSEKTAKAR